MILKSLELDFFRNYVHFQSDFDPRVNLIYGENAQGKTNLLEAIVYLSCGKSPRARTDREMIAFDAPAAVLEAGISARDREFRTRVELYRDRRRKMWVNQVPAKNSAALSQDLIHSYTVMNQLPTTSYKCLSEHSAATCSL